ncbi:MULTISPECIES: glutaminase [Streptomyces]|uniref:Glutaminase n=2 Tax=Streptomyces rimosus subsp. rimosus TaxID=132474 RepID=A0A8A1UR88_STRR1|nr:MULTISPECIES: glutaminase [Streptomyces]KOG70657.1 glutaminase [Kitasatospora aureofaciens]MYT41518.1 glutaminase [Streptomyces sp. SID5471]KEF05476.1 glutaminase [Streptomyces rimosus]KEF21312.1 glutaminase [Streptomyces rimosus]KOT31992.1 glutaminase [Streptomyces sp. NRRL WC-3701]
MDYQAVLEEVAAFARPYVGHGQVADYIPALEKVPMDRFGIAVADINGEVYGVGDWEVPFSVQSISKTFSLALVMANDNDDIWKRVGREPSGTPFNSLVQLEWENGVPRNPFINAGALVVTDRLQTLTGDASTTMLHFLREESGNPDLAFDQAVADSEADHGDRNAALAHFMASFGNLENPVPSVIEHYFWQCSIEMSCRDLAAAGGFLARHGLRADGSRLLEAREAKRINAVMLTCGTYDAAGEFAYRVGLPAKSGVGGGIVAVVPGRCTLCVWSPGLDRRGNSVAGAAALDHFTTLTGWSVF